MKFKNRSVMNFFAGQLSGVFSGVKVHLHRIWRRAAKAMQHTRQCSRCDCVGLRCRAAPQCNASHRIRCERTLRSHAL